MKNVLHNCFTFIHADSCVLYRGSSIVFIKYTGYILSRHLSNNQNICRKIVGNFFFLNCTAKYHHWHPQLYLNKSKIYHILPLSCGCWTIVASMMASGAAHLSSSKLNLGLLRDFYRREFLECIDKCLGTKVILCEVYLLAGDGSFSLHGLLFVFLKCCHQITWPKTERVKNWNSFVNIQ